MKGTVQDCVTKYERVAGFYSQSGLFAAAGYVIHAYTWVTAPNMPYVQTRYALLYPDEVASSFPSNAKTNTREQNKKLAGWSPYTDVVHIMPSELFSLPIEVQGVYTSVVAYRHGRVVTFLDDDLNSVATVTVRTKQRGPFDQEWELIELSMRYGDKRLIVIPARELVRII